MPLCPECRGESIRYHVAASGISRLLPKQNQSNVAVCSRCGEEFNLDKAAPQIELSDNNSDVETDDYSKKFPTIELTLKEAILRYEDEQRRRSSVEEKIGIIVTGDALLVSVIGILGQQLEINTEILLIILFPALVSVGVGLWLLRSRAYGRPGKKIEDFHDYSKLEYSEQIEKHLLDYEVATSNNRELNDMKFTGLDVCIFLTVLTLLFLLISIFTVENLYM